CPQRGLGSSRGVGGVAPLNGVRADKESLVMAAVSVAPRAASTPDWSRKYPPLLALGVAALLMLAVLPNSLNLPQTNPTQTLEYAPVPPDKQSDEVPPSGNLAAVGLGTSSGIKGGGAPGGNSAPGPE